VDDNNFIAVVVISPLIFIYKGDDMEEQFSNLLNYYRSVSIAKKLVEQNILTQNESQLILDKLKKNYKIIDEYNISSL
jgi:hypothetical protein